MIKLYSIHVHLGFKFSCLLYVGFYHQHKINEMYMSATGVYTRVSLGA